jgi:hypothetical protein
MSSGAFYFQFVGSLAEKWKREGGGETMYLNHYTVAHLSKNISLPAYQYTRHVRKFMLFTKDEFIISQIFSPTLLSLSPFRHNS